MDFLGDLKHPQAETRGWMRLEWNFDHEKLEKSGGLKGIEWDAIGIVELDFMKCHIVI